MTRTDLAYRRSAAEAASDLGPLIALFDTLAGDLRRAAAAQRSGDIEGRCDEMRHALLVVGFLEDWVNRGDGGDLANQLLGFYAMLRRNLIEAGVKQSAMMMEQQMARVLKLRELWQRFESSKEAPGPEIMRPALQGPSAYFAAQLEHHQGSWSA
jgi:flagellar secretion chaperone FliS